MSTDEPTDVVPKKEGIISQLSSQISAIINSFFGLPQMIKDWVNSPEGSLAINSLAYILSPFDAGFSLSVIVPYLQSLANTDKRERFSKHIVDVKKQLDGKQFNRNFVSSELGKKLLDEMIKTIIEETDKEKIEAKKSLFINAITSKSYDELLYEQCNNMLKRLDGVDIAILRTYFSPQDAITDLYHKLHGNVRDYTNMELPKSLSIHFDMDIDIFNISIDRLHQEKLIRHATTILIQGKIEESDVEGTINRTVNDVRNGITNFGMKFIKMIIRKQGILSE